MDKAAFDEESDDAAAKLDDLKGKSASPRLDLDDADFNAKLDADEARLDALKAKAASLNLGSAGSGGGGGESGGGGEGSLLGAISLVGGGLLPGVGGAVAGLGLLGATGGLAFGGIGKALSAAHQSSENVGLTGAQLSATNFSNQVQVVQAQQSVSQARRQAAQDAVTSGQQIQQADMNVAETERNTAASQVQALQSVTEAQQQVQTATYSLSEANYNLAQAYEQAREKIAQAQDQLADSKLSVAAASLAVQQAEYQEKLVNQDAYSTSIDRQQAALAVAQAQQQVKDATDNQTAAQYQSNLVTKQGIDGSQDVIQAKQGVTAAQYQLTDASKAYAEAQTALKNTELNNATQLKEAQMQAAAAREQAAYQQKSDAIAVAVAEKNLTDTIEEQKLQMAAMQSTANQAANQFLKDMSKLTPAGRGFVNQVLGMRGAFKGLEADAQNSTLPGFTTFLQGVSHLMPQIGSGVTKMGSAISKSFARMGTEMKTPQAVTVLNGLVTNGMVFANTVLPSIGRAFGAIFDLGSSKGASAGLSNLVGGMFDGVAGFAKGLKPYIPDFNDIFTALGKIAKALGPQLAKDIGGVAKVLDPLAKFLNSKQGQPFVDGIAKVVGALLTVKGLAKLLPGELGKAVGKIPGQAFGALASPVEKAVKDKILGPIGKTLKSQLGNVFKGAFGSAAAEGEEAAGAELGKSGGMSSLIGGIGNLLSGIPGKITPIVEGIKNWGIWSKVASGATKLWTGIQAGFDLVMDANPIVLVALALVALGVGLVEAYKHFAWFRDMVKSAWEDIEKGALFLWHGVFEPVWDGIKHAAQDAWNFIFNGFGKYLLPLLGPAGLIALGVIELSKHWKQIWGDIKTAASDVWGWLKTGAEAVVSAVSGTWGKLESVFKTPVNFLIKTVYDKGIAALWNDVVGAVGLGSLKLPVIAGLAHGGMVPGTDHGRDEVLIAARPQEGVLVPGAVRAIGGPGAIDALNTAHGGGGTGKQGHYSLGGIVKGFLSGGADTAKAITALSTGNTTAFVNALSGLIGTSAAGELGQVMVAMPKTLLTDAAKAAIGMLGGGSSGGGGTITGQVAAWFAAAVKAAGVPVSWISDLETIGKHESSLNANAVNLDDSNAAAGDPSRGVMQDTLATFNSFHAPGTSTNIFDPIANIAASARYIQSRYGSPANVPGIVALNQGRPYVGYDSGGWLPPGMTAAVNMTGKPEAVLTAEQSQALSQLAAGKGAQPPAAPTVVNNWYGPQMPSQEMLAEMERRQSLTLSGG
jgi:SLT domain-containing protein